MRAIGQRSVASVLERLLSVAWYGVVLSMLAASFVGLLPLWWDVSSLETKNSHLTVILAEVARFAAGLVFGRYAVSHFAAEGVQFLTRPEVNVLPLIEGVMILVISEVFRVCTRLEEDQAFTV